MLHLFVTISLIGTILIQQSEGGGLGIGGSSQSALFTARGSANFLTKITGILATIFIINCLVYFSLMSLFAQNFRAQVVYS